MTDSEDHLQGLPNIQERVRRFFELLCLAFRHLFRAVSLFHPPPHLLFSLLRFRNRPSFFSSCTPEVHSFSQLPITLLFAVSLDFLSLPFDLTNKCLFLQSFGLIFAVSGTHFGECSHNYRRVRFLAENSVQGRDFGAFRKPLSTKSVGICAFATLVCV